MDALARLAPVAGPLLSQVDAALATLGAPAEHPIWGLLRRLGTTPGDAVRYITELAPDQVAEPAARLRAQADTFAAATIPAHIEGWSGAAAAVYGVEAAGLAAHQRDLADRLRRTASFVDDVAAWCQRSRDHLARCLADVLGSAQAIAVRAQPSLGSGLAEALRDAGTTRGVTAAVAAAADIGVAVLTVAEEVWVAARSLSDADLAEVVYRAPVHDQPLHEALIRLR